MNRADLGFLDKVDWRNPDVIDEDGSRRFDIRCRLPFSGPTPGFASLVARSIRNEESDEDR